MSALLAFLGFESALLACSGLLVALFVGRAECGVLSRAELVTAWAGLKLLLGSVVPMLVGFAGRHTQIVYLVLAGVTLVVVLMLSMRAAIRESWWSLFDAISRPLETAHAAAVVLVLTVAVVLLAATANRVSELDSRFAFSFVWSWVTSSQTPYSAAHHYPSLWECSYVPTIVLLKRNDFFWWISAQAVLLFGLGAYALGRRLRFGPVLAVLLAAHGTLLYHFWIGPSGVATLKTDMVYNAGLLLVPLAILMAASPSGSGSRQLSWVLSACGFSFALIKYSGVAVVVVFLVVGALVAARRGSQVVRRMSSALAIGGSVGLVVTGHFYLHNLIVNGSPFYPIEFTLGPIHLPGTLNLQGTSIAASILDPALWTHLLTPHQTTAWAGVLGRFLLAPGAIIVAAFAVRAVIAFARGRSTSEAELAALVAAGLLLAFGTSFWSASDKAGDLMYVREGASVRYASAALYLTSAVIVAWLGRSKRAAVIIGAAVLYDCGSRIRYIGWKAAWGEPVLGAYRQTPALVLIAILVAAAVLVAVKGRHARWRLAGWIALPVIVLVAGLGWAENNRPAWLPEYRATVDVADSPLVHRVFMISALAGERLTAMPDAVLGSDFENEVDAGSFDELLEKVKAGRNYDEIALMTLGELDPTSAAKVVSSLSGFGYMAYARTPWNLVITSGPATTLVTVDDIGDAVWTRRMYLSDCWRTDGDVVAPTVASAEPLGVWKRQADGCYLAMRTSGPAKVPTNLGRNAGGFDGVALSVDGTRVRFDRQSWTRLLDQPTALHLRAASLGGWAQAAPNETVRVEVGPGSVRQVASTAVPWMAVTGPLRALGLANGTVTAWAVVRAPEGRAPNLHWYDFEGKSRSSGITTGVGTSDWQVLTASHDFGADVSRDYFGVGLTSVQAGDVLEIAEAVVVPGVLAVIPDEDLVSASMTHAGL